MRTGLDAVLDLTDAGPLANRQFGLLMNHASVDKELVPAHRLLARCFPGRLKAVFCPQHGMWGEEQANMRETPHGRDPQLDIPIYSLYSDLRMPAAKMLADLDCLVVDLQDVGCRVYTFIWTVANCLRACADRELPVVILDRINPLGRVVCGPLLQPGFESFVGLAQVPLQHGLSLGELARTVNHLLDIGADVEVVPVSDWPAERFWPETRRVWLPTSPNLPTFESLCLYPGLVLLEGTNLSEGRGTTMPFQMVGAPWIDGETLMENLQHHPGVVMRAARFRPVFDKWHDQGCGGISLHPLTARLDAVAIATDIISTCNRLWPDKFEWAPPPYEYEYTRMPIDILFGSDDFRTAVDTGAEVSYLPPSDWGAACQEWLLYDSPLEFVT